jgi:ADP-ribose pyrophosphatase YjhB (NUDIX family)
MKKYKNPIPTADIIIEITRHDGREGIILIERKNPPFGWAIPGGFVDYGESLEQAAVREAKEETALDVCLKFQMQTYSDPDRDPRKHTISTVFVATAKGKPTAQDDAKKIGIFTKEEITFPLVFDHRKILDDYFQRKNPRKLRRRRIGHSKPKIENEKNKPESRIKV